MMQGKANTENENMTRHKIKILKTDKWSSGKLSSFPKARVLSLSLIAYAIIVNFFTIKTL